MPRAVAKHKSRFAVRDCADDNATLMKAVALGHTETTDFVLCHRLDAARKVIDQTEHRTLSERDSRRALKASANPPRPNASSWRRRAACPKTREFARLARRANREDLRRRRRRSWAQPEEPLGVGRAVTLSVACMDQPCRASSGSHRIPTPCGAGYDSY